MGMMSGEISFDHLLDRVGGSGRWQVLLFLLTSSTGFFSAFHSLASIFLASIPDHWCFTPNSNNESAWGSNWTQELIKEYAIPREADGKYSKCSIYHRNFSADVFQQPFMPSLVKESNGLSKEWCNSYTYDHATFQDTVVTEWNLVCDNKALASLVQSMYMIGVFIGTFTYGLISDRFGRRTATLISVVEFVVSPILASFPVHYIWFLVFRMLTGMGGGGIFGTTFVLMAEWIHPKVRDIVGIGYQIPFGFGYMVLAGIAYEIRSWGKLQLIIGIANAALLVYFWLLPESPRWLIMNNRIPEALPILRTAAKFNGKKGVTDSEITALMEACAKAEAERRKGNSRQPSTVSILADLFRTTQMRKRILVSYFIWLSVSMCYYGLSLNAPKLGNDIYLVTLLSALTEIPSYIIGCCIIRFLPRKINIMGTFIISGASCLFILIVPKGETAVITGLALCGKFFINIAYSIVYLYTTEIFPTGNRNVALGTSSMCARVGAAISPFISDLLGGITPLIIFGVASCTSGVLCILLPETKDRTLPESVRDVEKQTVTAIPEGAGRAANDVLHM